MRAAYNEIDRFCCDRLSNLMDAGLITPGPIFDYDIHDLDPEDLRGIPRVHLFAGIAGWDYALRLAGWPLDRPVWTCSCPCQPFSDAGAQGGFDDPRHLWPEAFRLIEVRRPSVVFGEQVASPLGRAWLDVVFADLEGGGYACGAGIAPAAGVGAPHGRHRTYWLADVQARGWREFGGALESGEFRHPDGGRPQSGGVDDAEDARRQGRLSGRPDAGRGDLDRHLGRVGAAGGLADAGQGGCALERAGRLHADGESGHDPARCGAYGGLADADRGQRRGFASAQGIPDWAAGGRVEGDGGVADDCETGWPGAVDGFWRAADWIFCRDNKWRPIEPESFPLAHGFPNRVGWLRAFGNSIVSQLAAEFIGAYLDLM